MWTGNLAGHRVRFRGKFRLQIPLNQAEARLLRGGLFRPADFSQAGALPDSRASAWLDQMKAYLIGPVIVQNLGNTRFHPGRMLHQVDIDRPCRQGGEHFQKHRKFSSFQVSKPHTNLRDLLLRCSSAFQYRFNIYDDVHFVAHNDSPAIHCILPADPKVLAIDPGCC